MRRIDLVAAQLGENLFRKEHSLSLSTIPKKILCYSPKLKFQTQSKYFIYIALTCTFPKTNIGSYSFTCMFLSYPQDGENCGKHDLFFISNPQVCR